MLMRNLPFDIYSTERQNCVQQTDSENLQILLKYYIVNDKNL